MSSACEGGPAERSTGQMTEQALKTAVLIEFFGMQRVVAKTDSIDMPIAANARVTDALDYVRYRYPDLPLDEEIVFPTVNLEMASLDTVLKPNDTVSFLPFIGALSSFANPPLRKVRYIKMNMEACIPAISMLTGICTSMRWR